MVKFVGGQLGYDVKFDTGHIITVGASSREEAITKAIVIINRVGSLPYRITQSRVVSAKIAE